MDDTKHNRSAHVLRAVSSTEPAVAASAPPGDGEEFLRKQNIL